MMLICIDFTTDSARCIFEWLWLRRPVRAWKFGWTAIPLTLFDHLIPSLGAFQLFFFAAHLRITGHCNASLRRIQKAYPPTIHLVNFATAFGTLTIRGTNRANESHVASLPHLTMLHCAARPETLVPVANGPIANEAVVYNSGQLQAAVRDAGSVLALAALHDADVNMRRAQQPRERAASADGWEERGRLVVNDFKDGIEIKVRCIDRLGFAVLAQREGAERFGKQHLCCHACCILLRVVVAKSHSPRRINPIQLYFERCVVNFAPHSTRRAEENATISALPCRAAF